MKRAIVKRKKARPLVVKGKVKVRVTGRRRIAKSDLVSYAREVFSRLVTAHPDAHCELDYETPLQLLEATILSAQCTDKRVNMVTPVLFRTFPTAAVTRRRTAGEAGGDHQEHGLLPQQDEEPDRTRQGAGGAP